MTIVYNKDGVEFKVPHKVDVQGWIDAGYFLVNPKEKATKK